MCQNISTNPPSASADEDQERSSKEYVGVVERSVDIIGGKPYASYVYNCITVLLLVRGFLFLAVSNFFVISKSKGTSA